MIYLAMDQQRASEYSRALAEAWGGTLQALTAHQSWLKQKKKAER